MIDDPLVGAPPLTEHEYGRVVVRQARPRHRGLTDGVRAGGDNLETGRAAVANIGTRARGAAVDLRG